MSKDQAMSIPRVHLSGSPREMGLQFGRACGDAIHRLSEERLRLVLADLENQGKPADRKRTIEVARRMLDIQAAWNPEVHEEFMGIAQGAEIDPALLLIGNGYTDFRDVVLAGEHPEVTECTSFIALSSVTADGRALCGQTWDMHASAEAFIVLVYREPRTGPRTLSLTTAGCLTLIGVNEAGLAAGNTNLTPTDARPGVVYLPMLHAALATETVRDAVKVIVEAPRASGHHYYFAHARDEGLAVETTALDYALLEPEDGIYTHTNHYRDRRLKGQAPSENSRSREAVMLRHLQAKKGAITAEVMKQVLADRTGEPHCICRYGDEIIDPRAPERSTSRSCAAAVIDPAAKGLWAVWGPPDKGEWEWASLV